MGDNNVASIGKMLMQTQSGQSVTGVDGADIGTTFRKMVDQMTQIPGSSVSTGSVSYTHLTLPTTPYV